MKMNELKCKHYDGDGFGYELSYDEIVLLCDSCNLNLAHGVMGQVAIATFAKGIANKLPPLESKEQTTLNDFCEEE